MAKSTKANNKTGSTKIRQELPVVLTEPDNGLMELFINGIMEVYWAENQLVKCLPKLQQAVSSDVLSDAIGSHLEETKAQAERLESVFDTLGYPVRAQKCDAMEGLTKEGEAVIEMTDPGSDARDFGIIMASRKVEHYEMVAYDGLIALANRLGLADVAGTLQEIYDEEQNSDAILSEIATEPK